MRIVLLEKRMMILNYNHLNSSDSYEDDHDHHYDHHDHYDSPRLRIMPMPTLFISYLCTAIHSVCTFIHHTLPYPTRILAVVDPLVNINIAHPHSHTIISISPL
jgi:hypothetical protein